MANNFRKDNENMYFWSMKRVIVVVDELYDFIEGGSLACAHSLEAVAATKRLIAQNPDTPVLFVCDHHPANHCSFAAQGGPWPPHCVAGTHGAEIHEDLQAFVQDGRVFFKGCDPSMEQYSGFEGRNAAGQALCEVLETLAPEEVVIAGIATEYCVYNTVVDLRKAGWKVVIAEDCLGWVDAEGHAEALAAMGDSGT
ncbi:MAG: isochorismatase family protein [Bacteroidales bacterium]|nr:isochorismatase family protein [Bacteroidales bacterium]